jgi:3-deoxy-D-manno-octulosonic-acid transferase
MFLYNTAVRLYQAGIRIAAFFYPKARLWIEGRRRWRHRYGEASAHWAIAGFRPRVVWIHAASLGEFEQGRPVAEAIRGQFPDWKIVLTFFSPSGYEVRKNYPHADLVCYLPADTCRNAADFLQIIRPDIAIFIKYEFWANYLFELKKREIPTLLVSALFRERQPFFRWYGGFWRDMLRCYTHIFVQNEPSAKLLQNIGFQNISISGDTRVDRVLQLAGTAPENQTVAVFAQSATSTGLLIAGSTWPPDDNLLATAMQSGCPLKLVVAPHDPSPQAVSRIETLFSGCGKVLRYSQATPTATGQASVLIIDNVGMLNTLYRYGKVAYIGGGFGKGIHNTLEPAAYGLPILFGPRYQKFEEARQFVAAGGAFPVEQAAELTKTLQQLSDPAVYNRASEAVSGYLTQNRGATTQVIDFITARFTAV